MPAVVVRIADAVVDTLNAATLSQPFAAARAWAVDTDLPDLAGLTVTVVPPRLAVAAIDLGRRAAFDHDVQVVVEKRAAGRADADALALLAEEVVDLFRAGWSAPGLPTSRVVRFEVVVVDPERLDAAGVFRADVTLTVRVTR